MLGVWHTLSMKWADGAQRRGEQQRRSTSSLILSSAPQLYPTM